MTHIMWLTNVAPENQEETLFLARAESGPGTFKEIDVRRIARGWTGVCRRGSGESSRLNRFFLAYFMFHLKT